MPTFDQYILHLSSKGTVHYSKVKNVQRKNFLPFSEQYSCQSLRIKSLKSSLYDSFATLQVFKSHCVFNKMTEVSFLDEKSLEKAEMHGKLNHYESIRPIMAIQTASHSSFSASHSCLLDSDAEVLHTSLSGKYEIDT